MFALAFDLTVAKVKRHHPKGVSQAYRDIGRELRTKGFERTQGSVYLTERNDLANLFAAVRVLEGLPWLPHCIRDIRGFRVEEWSDFTPIFAEKARDAELNAGAAARKQRSKSGGLKEDASPYSADATGLVGQVRRFGEEGPAYEIVELAEDDEVLIEVVYSGERITLPFAEVMADPIAETIP